MDYYAEALVQFERRTWREDGRAYYLARLEKRLFELSRDLTIADWKAIRNEHYWSDKAWVQTRSWPTIEKEIAISKIWTYPSGNPQIRRYRWTQMVSNTCTGRPPGKARPLCRANLPGRTSAQRQMHPGQNGNLLVDFDGTKVVRQLRKLNQDKNEAKY